MVQTSWIGLRFPNRKSKKSEETLKSTNVLSEGKKEEQHGTHSAGISHEWSVLPVQGIYPEPRYNHAATVLGKKMVIVGGESSNGLLADVQVLNLAKLSWTQLEIANYNETALKNRGEGFPPCKGHSLISWGKIVLLIGGISEPCYDRIEVWALDIKAKCWTKIQTKGDIPVARSGQSVTKAGSILIIFGGEDSKGRKLKDINMFDLKSFTWVPLQTRGTLPSARSRHVATMYNDRLMLIFGGVSRSKFLNDMFTLDLERMEWSKLKSQGFTPSRRAGCCGVLSGHFWYILGGENRKLCCNETLVFNIETMTWSNSLKESPNSVVGNRGVSAVAFCEKEGTFLIAFGGLKHDNELSNEVLLTQSVIPYSIVNQNYPWKGESAPLQNLFENDYESSVDSLFVNNRTAHIAIAEKQSTNNMANPKASKSCDGMGLPHTVNEPTQVTASDLQLPTYYYGLGSSERQISHKKILHLKEKLQLLDQCSPEECSSNNDLAEGSEAQQCFSECAYKSSSQASIIEKGPGGGEECNGSPKLNSKDRVSSSRKFNFVERTEVEENKNYEVKLAEAMEEIESLKGKVAAAELAKSEANDITNIVHTENVRLEHDIAFLKAVLDNTQRELQTTRGILDAERTRAFQLQVEVFQLRQKADSVDWRVLVQRKMQG